MIKKIGVQRMPGFADVLQQINFACNPRGLCCSSRSGLAVTRLERYDKGIEGFVRMAQMYEKGFEWEKSGAAGR